MNFQITQNLYKIAILYVFPVLAEHPFKEFYALFSNAKVVCYQCSFLDWTWDLYRRAAWNQRVLLNSVTNPITNQQQPSAFLLIPYNPVVNTYEYTNTFTLHFYILPTKYIYVFLTIVKKNNIHVLVFVTGANYVCMRCETEYLYTGWAQEM